MENPYIALDIRKVPCSMDAEQSVLGAALIDPACFVTVHGIVSQTDFYNPQHQWIYHAMRRAASAGKMDAVIVADFLEAHEVYSKEDGRNYLLQLARFVPSIANVESYARIVHEKALERQAIEKVGDVLSTLLDGGGRAEAEQAAGELLQLLAGKADDQIFSFAQMFREFNEEMRKPIKYMQTGMALLDKHTMLEGGDYVIVGGRPSSGKTALTIQLMMDLSKRCRVAYFSLETNPRKLFHRAVANRSGVALRDIKQHDIFRDERDRSITEAVADYLDAKIYLVSAAGWTVEKIHAAALKLRADVIFVDYLGLIQRDGKSLYERVTEISKGLHTLAQSTGITVVALSQLNRGKEGEEISMKNLRESGQIEQDADVILLIVDPSEGKNVQADPRAMPRNLVIAKNKEGECGSIPLLFDGECQRFSVQDSAHAEYSAPARKGHYPEWGNM